MSKRRRVTMQEALDHLAAVRDAAAADLRARNLDRMAAVYGACQAAAAGGGAQAERPHRPESTVGLVLVDVQHLPASLRHLVSPAATIPAPRRGSACCGSQAGARGGVPLAAD